MTAEAEAEKLLPCGSAHLGCYQESGVWIHDGPCPARYRPAVAAAIAAKNAEIATSDARIAALEAALTQAAEALEAVAERTWDKRHHDECRSACDDASMMANEAGEAARTALSAQPGGE